MIESLDLWGGSGSYNTETETLTINRLYGFYSNIIITLYGICKLKSQRYNVKKIELYLNEYIQNYDFYHDLFLYKEMTDEIISIEEALSVIDNIAPSVYGFGSNIRTFDKEKLEKYIKILIKIYNHYFTNNINVQNYIDNIIKKYSIELDNTVFIWARRTDKYIETELPDASDYINEAHKCNDIKKILVQTDDLSLVDEFKSINDHLIQFLNELPYSQSNDKGFHNHLSSICNNDFENTHGMSKINYLQKFLATTNIASKSKYFISYPGNMMTIVPIMRQNFDNCKLFLNKKDIV
jgi:hypothetical protein